MVLQKISGSQPSLAAIATGMLLALIPELQVVRSAIIGPPTMKNTNRTPGRIAFAVPVSGCPAISANGSTFAAVNPTAV